MSSSDASLISSHSNRKHAPRFRGRSIAALQAFEFVAQHVLHADETDRCSVPSGNRSAVYWAGIRLYLHLLALQLARKAGRVSAGGAVSDALNSAWMDLVELARRHVLRGGRDALLVGKSGELYVLFLVYPRGKLPA